MKISVLGAGAIGSMIGGLIKQHDSAIDVLLLVRGAHGEAVQRQGGVLLEGPWGKHNVRVRSSFDPADIAGSDYVLVTVKSQATREALQSVRPHLSSAVVISIQNGINHPALLEYVPPERLVVGMTATNIAVLEPGRVSLQLDGTSIVGPPPGTVDRIASESALAVLRKSGLRFELHPQIAGVQYNKLAINAVGYASCLSASNFITEALLHRPWRDAVGLPILEECRATFQRAGIELAHIPGVPDLDRLTRFLKLADAPVVGTVVQAVARRKFDRKPIVFSLYQDLLRGKATEVDFINGEVVRLAELHGGQAPTNALVVQLVHELEQRGSRSFFSREEVVERFRNAATASLAGRTVSPAGKV